MMGECGFKDKGFREMRIIRRIRRRGERQDRKNRGYKDKGTESRWSLLGEEVW